MSSPYAVQRQCNNVALRTFYCALQNLVWINLLCLQHRSYEKIKQKIKSISFFDSTINFYAFI